LLFIQDYLRTFVFIQSIFLAIYILYILVFKFELKNFMYRVFLDEIDEDLLIEENFSENEN
jgi:hypothetical protein